MITTTIRENSDPSMFWFASQVSSGNAELLTKFLIGEVMMSGGEGLHDPSYHRDENAVKKNTHHLAHLVDILFDFIIKKLRSIKLTIVIDSVSLYEDENRQEDTQLLFDSLAKLVAIASKDAELYPLRLVVTSPTYTNFARKVPALTVDVPHNSEI